MEDELAYAREQAERKGTAWIKEVPGQNRWLSGAIKTFESLHKTYAPVVKDTYEKDGNTHSCGDALKALFLTRAWMKEFMSLFPEALQAMLDDSDGEDDDKKKGKTKKEDKVLGFELIEGPEGVPCLGVKLRKKNVEERDMAERLASRVSSLFYDGPPQQSRRM